MNTLKETIPDDAKEILDIWEGNNEAYREKYGLKAIKKHILIFLDLKGKEYDRLRFVIGHCLATLTRIDVD